MVRTGRRLAVDVGKARIGLAISDFHGILGSPLATIQRVESLDESVLEVLRTAEREGDLLEIYVGIPVNLQGNSTESTHDALGFAEALARLSQVPTLLLDERLTTQLANNQLKQINKSQKDARSTIDQMAAVAILEYALSIEANSNTRPGMDIESWRRDHE